MDHSLENRIRERAYEIGPHMAMCTAKPISIGLRPSGKSWRHRRPRSPANPPRKRCAGRLHVRKPLPCAGQLNAAHAPPVKTPVRGRRTDLLEGHEATVQLPAQPKTPAEEAAKRPSFTSVDILVNELAAGPRKSRLA